MKLSKLKTKTLQIKKNSETQILIGEKDLAEEVEVIASSPSASPTNFDVSLEKEIKDADNEKLRLQIELAKIGG